ncbi:hypothetical protein Pfo_021850 [Paulownia fortunei]|nr:hypothetical protein Pfo_021850 [Paulownia fortunei]
MDSGATNHMTHSSQKFSIYNPCPSNRKITTADGSLTTIAGIGDVPISPTLILKNVFHVPMLSTSLVSIQKLTQDLCCNVILHPTYCVFQDQDSGKAIGRAKERNGLYYLETPSNSSVQMSKSPLSFFSEHSLSNKEKIWLYHRRLGHPSFRTLNILFPSLSKGLDVKNFHCEVCELVKHKRVPFPISNKRSSVPFSLIHSGIWGPSPIPNIFGACWFVSLIDDCTRISWIFLLKNKSDVSFVLPNFHIMVQNQFGVKIKQFRSDNAREYFNQVLTPYFEKEGIIHESSCVSTPQQNGIPERKKWSSS